MADSTGDDRTKRDAELTRRDMLKLTVSAAIAAPLVTNAPEALAQAAKRAAAAAKGPRFFTKPEFALLDELTEIIIPADDQSGGARAAKVAEYIDFRLGESLETDEQEKWRSGLKAIDALSQTMHKKAFMAATPDERIALLTAISKNEFEPKTPEETFFRELKSTTAGAYYSSDIGIHKDIGYLGNTYQQGEYAGIDVSPEAPLGSEGASANGSAAEIDDRRGDA